MARSRVAQGQARSKSQAKSASDNREMLARELIAVSASLGEALGDIIEAHMEDDTQAFGLALRRVNSARVVLQGEAAKLEVVQP